MHAKRFLHGATSLLLLAALAACGGESSDSELGVFTGAPERVAGGSGSTGGGGGLVVDSADQVQTAYVETSLTAPAGTFNVTFNNKGALPHNWTLVPEGEEDAAVAGSKGPDYIYADSLGHSALLQAGASDTFEVNAPEPGTYTYLCTFPGHYATGMHGTLTVTEGGAVEAGGASGSVAPGSGTPVTVDSADAANTAYAETTLEVPAGDVTVTFNNKSALPHNWTLVAEGEEQQAIDDSTPNAPEYNYDGALAHTKMLNGGASDAISFNVQPGTYTYLCTFPGHYAQGMHGTLVVK